MNALHAKIGELAFENDFLEGALIIDIFSHRIVRWHVAAAKAAALFKPLIDDALRKHDIAPGQLTLHADHGGPMKAKATALLLAALGIVDRFRPDLPIRTAPPLSATERLSPN